MNKVINSLRITKHLVSFQLKAFTRHLLLPLPRHVEKGVATKQRETWQGPRRERGKADERSVKPKKRKYASSSTADYIFGIGGVSRRQCHHVRLRLAWLQQKYGCRCVPSVLQFDLLLVRMCVYTEKEDEIILFQQSYFCTNLLPSTPFSIA